MSDVILMGPPGSGKGTQARLLVDTGGWAQLATGDLFREHARKGTSLGREAAEYMAKGLYVPDDVTIRMVEARMRDVAAGTRMIFDGFPRTVAQAEALDPLLRANERRIGLVVLFEVARERLLERLGHRATCSNCQAVYSPSSPPAVPGVCDRCGGPVASTARPDESPQIARERLVVFDEKTRPVVEHYASRGMLHRVNGEGAIEEIAARLRPLLNGSGTATAAGRGAPTPGAV